MILASIVSSLLLFGCSIYYYRRFSFYLNKAGKLVMDMTAGWKDNELIEIFRWRAILFMAIWSFPLFALPFVSDVVNAAALILATGTMLTLIYGCLIIIGKINLSWFKSEPLWLRLFATFFLSIIAMGFLLLLCVAIKEPPGTLDEVWDHIKNRVWS